MIMNRIEGGAGQSMTHYEQPCEQRNLKDRRPKKRLCGFTRGKGIALNVIRDPDTRFTSR
jgi:hypothetical protein